MKKMFITSNQQFGRHNAISEFQRDFVSVDAMDEYMIEQWNSVVSKDAMVYVIGNFAWDPETAEQVIKRLNGEIILLVGVWDHATKEIAEKFGKQLGLSITNEGVRFFKSLNMCVSYWPLSDWPNRDKGSVSVVGVHNDEFKTDHKQKRINVSADYWDFKPVDVVDIVNLFKDPDLE